MTKIRFSKTTPEYRKFDADRPRLTRRPYDEVLGHPTSASPRGSTYWKRVRRCPREHALYEGGLRRVNPFTDAIVIGLICHLALEHYYLALKAGRFVEAERDAWWAIAPFSSESGYEEVYETVERMLARYFELYRETDVLWKIVAVEETVSYMDPELELSARLDLLIEKEGLLWIVEHKTHKFITEDLLSGYQMDLQIPAYCWLLRNVVDTTKLAPFAGAIVNIITKDRLPKLERVEVVPSRYHLAEFELSQRAWMKMRDTFPALGNPKTYGNCVGAPRYFSRCDYFDLCHGRPEATLHQLITEEPPHGFYLHGTEPTHSTIDPDEAM
jgi:hypothetical protein